jgi:hypothetical protein
MVVVAAKNAIAAPVVTESVLRSGEWVTPYWSMQLSSTLSVALLKPMQHSEDMADMSEWPPELDAESRAIHTDLAKASFRALPDD